MSAARWAWSLPTATRSTSRWASLRRGLEGLGWAWIFCFDSVIPFLPDATSHNTTLQASLTKAVKLQEAQVPSRSPCALSLPSCLSFLYAACTMSCHCRAPNTIPAPCLPPACFLSHTHYFSSVPYTLFQLSLCTRKFCATTMPYACAECTISASFMPRMHHFSCACAACTISSIIMLWM